jgi:amino acid transporter
MLTFISFWRAAAIVLNDLASSAYYAGGIAEQAVGKAAPWFILAVMLLSYAVRSVYIEGCGMFVRGGVYRVVKEAMGGTMANISVSALLFDYVLTGPISGVSAGQYLVGFLNELFRYARLDVHLSREILSFLHCPASPAHLLSDWKYSPSVDLHVHGWDTVALLTRKLAYGWE